MSCTVNLLQSQRSPRLLRSQARAHRFQGNHSTIFSAEERQVAEERIDDYWESITPVTFAPTIVKPLTADLPDAKAVRTVTFAPSSETQQLDNLKKEAADVSLLKEYIVEATTP